MFLGTQFQKWLFLAFLAGGGSLVAYLVPDPEGPTRPWFLVLMSLMFAKNWLEYLLFLPITGLRGLYIPTQDRIKRKRFFILTVLIYVFFMAWLLIYV